MNLLFFRATLCAAACVLLSHCSHPTHSRIGQHPLLYSALSARDRDLAAAGIVREGMSRDAVYLAWGQADRVSTGTQSGRSRSAETWTYLSQRPVSTVNGGGSFGWGRPYGGWDAGGSSFWSGGAPSITHLPSTQATVEFNHGRVTRWMMTPLN